MDTMSNTTATNIISSVETTHHSHKAEAASQNESKPLLNDSEQDDFARYQQFIQQKRRGDVKRGTKNVLMMEQMTDTTWRAVPPHTERDRFLSSKEKERFLSSKVGQLKSRQSSSWSTNTSPTAASPRNGAGSALSIATFAGVTDTHYISDMQRRLMYDRFKNHFRENTNIFPSDADIENASKKPPHTPRAISYIPVLVHVPITVKPHRLKPINREYDLPEEEDEVSKASKRHKRRSKKHYRVGGPTQYQSNTGLVMVMKPEEHALVGTVYEKRPLKEEYRQLQKFRVDTDKLQRENTHQMLERCDRLMHPHKMEKRKKNRDLQITPTDWNRTISATPNLNDLCSILGESPTQGGRRTRNSNKEIRVAKPISLEQVIKPDGKPKFYIDSVSKCVTWLNKNFS